MSFRIFKLMSAAALAGACILVGGGTASAQDMGTPMPNCDDGVTIKNPVFIQGSSALAPLYKAVGGGALLAGNADPAKAATLVYATGGSCVGVQAIAGATMIAAGTTLSYIPAGFDPAVTATVPQCVLQTPRPYDLAVSDVFFETCMGARPATISDQLGPAQAMLFIVPTASGQKAITAEEAYFVFGFGQAGMVTPWVDNMFQFIRSASSGTQNILGTSIKVAAAAWKFGIGDMGKGSAFVLGEVANSASPDKTIGILGADLYDGSTKDSMGNTVVARNVLKGLAFRGFGQYHAYYPDSKATTFDKQNVRDGHYLPFGYAHLIASTTPSATAQTFISVVKSNDKSVLAAVSAKAHLVPLCAMKVQRAADGGDISLYSDPAPCGCYFESLVNASKMPTAASCTTCPTDGVACGTGGMCRFGYCEAK